MKISRIFNLSLLLITIISFNGCKEDELMRFNTDTNYIQFAITEDDSIAFSFLQYPDMDIVDYEVEVEILGIPYTEKTAFKVSVDSESTTAIEGVHYTLPSEVYFEEGSYNSVYPITLYKTNDMDSVTYSLVLQIENLNDDALVGVNKTALISINNRLTKPDWWVETYYSSSGYWLETDLVKSILGYYSEYKYQCFIEATGIYDMTGFSYSEMYDQAITFKLWIDEHAGEDILIDPTDGSIVTIPVQF